MGGNGVGECTQRQIKCSSSVFPKESRNTFEPFPWKIALENPAGRSIDIRWSFLAREETPVAEPRATPSCPTTLLAKVATHCSKTRTLVSQLKNGRGGRFLSALTYVSPNCLAPKCPSFWPSERPCAAPASSGHYAR